MVKQITKPYGEVQSQAINIISEGTIFKGDISLKNNSGHADLRIPIEGDKGKGTIVLKGDKYNGDWTYEELYIIIKDTQEAINLLDKSLEGI